MEYKVPSDFGSLSEESSDGGDGNNERKRRAHRKTKDPSRRKCNMSLWQNVNVSFVERLPFDIDGLVIYRLAFNPKQRMHSSKDGKPWKTWVSSSRKGFKGKRRTARCNGGYKCENIKCPFLTMYKKNNRLQFEDDNGIKSCCSCGERAIIIIIIIIVIKTNIYTGYIHFSTKVLLSM